MRALSVLLSTLLVASPLSGGIAAAPKTASATLLDAMGKPVGTATLSQAAGGLRVRINANGLPTGIHGVHLHAVGTCKAPDFKTAGGHWNPTAKMHGKDNPGGMHMGDLPNLTIGSDGTGRLDARIAHGTLTGGTAPLLDGDGAAIVVHATADDYKTDPAGNSGARIACGVLSAG